MKDNKLLETLKAQAERCDEAIEFNYDSVTDWINNTEVQPGDVFNPSIYEAARWQFEQNRAALSALQKENEKLKECLEMWTQWNAKLQAENEWVKGNISGHIGAVDIFCERNDNLLAENAILREGLTKVGYALQSTDSTKMYAREVLTAADKVRA